MSCWGGRCSDAADLEKRDSLHRTLRRASRGPRQQLRLSFQSNIGPAGTEVAELANALHLKTEPPQNWTVAGYANLLTAHGPVVPPFSAQH
jgi:hypothetical protein